MREPDEPWFAEMLRLYADSPAHRSFGLTMREVSAGRVVVVVEAPGPFRNLSGGVHGGVLTTALDSALLQAVRSVLPGVEQIATQELKVNFIRPAKEMVFRVIGEVIHVGGSTGVARSLAVGVDQSPIATALGTIRFKRVDNLSD